MVLSSRIARESSVESDLMLSDVRDEVSVVARFLLRDIFVPPALLTGFFETIDEMSISSFHSVGAEWSTSMFIKRTLRESYSRNAKASTASSNSPSLGPRNLRLLWNEDMIKIVLKSRKRLMNCGHE